MLRPEARSLTALSRTLLGFLRRGIRRLARSLTGRDALAKSLGVDVEMVETYLEENEATRAATRRQELREETAKGP